jgi:hypothetical protein
VLAMLLRAGTATSFAQASELLESLAGLTISSKQVERRTHAIGRERCAERDAAVAAYHAQTLVERKGVPSGVTPPNLAVVQMDGGRLQIFDRALPLDEQPKTWWREEKVGWLGSMTSVVHEADPCPVVPSALRDEPEHIRRLVQEFHAVPRAGDEIPTADTIGPTTRDIPVSADPVVEYEPPTVDVRSVVATTREAASFGERLSCSAWERGFYGATRRAFLGDGSTANWGVWERHFSNFTPIVDFMHALTYVYRAATADTTLAEGWSRYQTLIASLWAGDVKAVIATLTVRHTALGPPEASDGVTHPRSIIAETIRYLTNQAERMRYAEYRQAGLPITTSHIESTIKLMNRRVKGTEKFWSNTGAEAIVQLRADMLSNANALNDFITRRAARQTGIRTYTLAA